MLGLGLALRTEIGSLGLAIEGQGFEWQGQRRQNYCA